jgi:hypothetical protein
MSRVDPTVFTLAATDNEPWGISAKTLEDLLDELTRAVDWGEPFEPEVVATAIDLSDQACDLLAEIDRGELQIPFEERYLSSLAMLSLALAEFDDVESWAELHEDAALLGIAERIH